MVVSWMIPCMNPHSVTLISIGEPMSPRMLPSRTPASMEVDQRRLQTIATEHARLLGGRALRGVGRLQFAARQRIEKHGEFLRKRHVGASHGADLFEAGAMPLGGFEETRVQHAHGAFGEAEHQVGAVLEIHVQQGARQSRAARDVVHGQRIETDLAARGFGGIHDFGATTFLLFESAFGDVAHGRRA